MRSDEIELDERSIYAKVVASLSCHQMNSIQSNGCKDLRASSDFCALLMHVQ